MGSLMTKSFQFEDIQRKYAMFSNPRVELRINGREFRKEPFIISNMRIELTSDFSSNFVTLSVRGVENEGQYEFHNDLEGLFELGSRVDIKVGYEDELIPVFTGFLSGKAYKMAKETPGELVVQCMDVKGSMMNSNSYSQTAFNSISDCARELFGTTPYSSVIDNFVVDVAKKKTYPVETTNESDYELLVRLAKNADYEFFVSQSTAYFRKAKSQNTSMGTLSFGSGLEELDIDYSILGVPNSVEVRNTDGETGALITGRARSSARYSSGSTASKILKLSHRVFWDSVVNSPDDANRRAEVILEELNWNFGVANLRCVGIPELIPGRFISLRGVFAEINKTFYVTNVTHIIETGRFRTYLKARLNSL
jgi:phage protein D